MAFLVVVALITFVLIPGSGRRDEFSSIFSRGRNQSLVSWKGGTLGQAELERMRMNQILSYRVFEKVYAEVTKNGGMPRIPSFQSNGQQFSLGIQPPPDADRMSPNQVYEALANQYLLTETAAKYGITVDDSAVDLFIQKFTDGKVSAKRFEEIIRETAGPELNRHQLYSFLKGEIARQLLVNVGDSGLSAPGSTAAIVTPAKNYSNFQKFQQRAKVEAYPVFVDEFLAKVTDKPSEQELRAIYERGKTQFLPADSPDPGFYRGYKTNLEFVVADMESFLKKAEAEITDEVLKAEYEKRVNDQGAFRIPVPVAQPTKQTPKAESTGEKPEAKETKAEEAKPDEKNPEGPSSDEAKPSEAKQDDAPKNTETTPTSDAVKETEIPKEPPQPEEPKADAPPADAPTVEAPKSSFIPLRNSNEESLTALAQNSPPSPSPMEEQRLPSPGLPGEGSGVRVLGEAPRTSVHLVAFQTEEKPAEPSGEVKAAVENATEKVAETGQVKPEEKTGEKSASETTLPSEEPSPPTPLPEDRTKGDETKPSAPSEPTKIDSTPTANVEAKPEEKKDETPMRTRTLDEVRDELKRELAMTPARQKRDEAIKAVREAMEKYMNDLDVYRSADPNDKTAIEPEPLDVAKLADTHGLTYGKTGMVDAYSIQSMPIGRSFLGDFRQSFPIGQVVFNPRVRLRLPLQSMGFDGTQLVDFLFCKVEEEMPRVPAFDECRDEVEKAWKMSQARRLASDKANELASRLNATNDADPWPGLLDESLRKLVIKPPMFTWLQPPFRSGDLPGLSNIDGIVQPGPNFMERVFIGKIGQAVVALDEPQQKAWVIRILERGPSEEELLTKFQSSPGTDDATRMLGQAQAQAMAQGWLVETQNSYNADLTRLQDLK
jgi:hypothetical protein